jgi:FkbM family methyltransferase
VASLPQAESNSQMAEQFDSIDAPSHLVPYDENLLERARTQWQFGDWQSLANLDRDTLQHHPDRAKLVLLAAAGRLQIGQASEARQYILLAQDWGCSKKHISQILISGVHNSIGIAAAIGSQHQRVALHFGKAIQIGTPSSDTKLLTQARIAKQTNQLSYRLTDVDYKVKKIERKNTDLENKKEAQLTKEKYTDLKIKFSSDAYIDEFINDISSFFKNNSIIYVDIGAYIGEVFTKFILSEKISIKEAHLIEPNPESYIQLQEAVKFSKLQNCSSYHVGISNDPGLAKFKSAKSMTKRVRADIHDEKPSSYFEIECRKLEEVLTSFSDIHINLMKIDVEGEELDVIKSGERLFVEQRIDVLYIEVGLNQYGKQQTYFGDIDLVLQGHGYRLFKFYEQKNEWIDDSPLLRRCNAAYLSSKFASIFKYSKLK